MVQLFLVCQNYNYISERIEKYFHVHIVYCLISVAIISVAIISVAIISQNVPIHFMNENVMNITLQCQILLVVLDLLHALDASSSYVVYLHNFFDKCPSISCNYNALKYFDLYVIFYN